jgi:hypothetical protein
MQASDTWDETLPFSVPELHIWMDEKHYLCATDLLNCAAQLFGDGAGGDLGENTEYERGQAELIRAFMGWSGYVEVEDVIEAVHGIAKDSR